MLRASFTLDGQRVMCIDSPIKHAFTFTRGIYSSTRRSNRRGGWGRDSWSVDYPKADLQFLTVLRRLTNLDAYNSEHAVALDDPELRRHPFVYMLEVGAMSLFGKANSWYVGANIPGKPRVVMPYAGGQPLYRERVEAVVKAGYEGFALRD